MRGAPAEAPPEYASPGAGEALERDHARAVAAAALLEPAAAAGAPRAPAASVHRAAAAGHSWLRRLPATPHAATTVEPALLACVRPPAVEYEPAIPRRLARAGALSDLQLEAVLAIGRTHSTLLPAPASGGCAASTSGSPSDGAAGCQGVRAGFLLADGPGVGKGRTQAACD